MGQINDGECLAMRGIKEYRRRDAHLPRFFPTAGAKAPFVTRLKARKSELRSRRYEVVSATKAVLQKLGSNGYADSMRSVVH